MAINGLAGLKFKMILELGGWTSSYTSSNLNVTRASPGGWPTARHQTDEACWQISSRRTFEKHHGNLVDFWNLFACSYIHGKFWCFLKCSCLYIYIYIHVYIYIHICMCICKYIFFLILLSLLLLFLLLSLLRCIICAHIRRPRRRQGGARQRRHCNQPGARNNESKQQEPERGRQRRKKARSKSKRARWQQ